MEQISHYLPGILMAYGAYVLSILTPGPNVLSVIGTSMGAGRKSGRALAWGIANGTCLWGAVTWGGLTSVLALYASVITVIKIFGASYLLWLAIKAFRSALSPNAMTVHQVTAGGDAWAYYRRGLLVQITNPKAVLAWIAIMSIGLESDAPPWVGGVILFGATVMSIVGHQIYAIVFSTDPMMNAYRRARRWIECGLGAFFCAASYSILASRD
jgi:amino acid exporter